jgi:hypothetical protein
VFGSTATSQLNASILAQVAALDPTQSLAASHAPMMHHLLQSSSNVTGQQQQQKQSNNTSNGGGITAGSSGASVQTVQGKRVVFVPGNTPMPCVELNDIERVTIAHAVRTRNSTVVINAQLERAKPLIQKAATIVTKASQMAKANYPVDADTLKSMLRLVFIYIEPSNSRRAKRSLLAAQMELVPHQVYFLAPSTLLHFEQQARLCTLNLIA